MCFFPLRPAVILYTKDELILIFKCHLKGEKKKKPFFFTLDPVAALAYNRTGRYGWGGHYYIYNNNNDDDDKNKCKNYNKLV